MRMMKSTSRKVSRIYTCNIVLLPSHSVSQIGRSMSIPSTFRLFSCKFLLHSILPPKSPILSFTTSSSSSYASKFPSLRSISMERLSLSPPFSSPTPDLQPLQEEQELPPKLQEIVRLFQAVQEPKSKYEQLLFYGRNLAPLDDQFKTIENKVQGCVSQVWVRAFFDSHKNVVFEADSDSVLTKGLAALLVQGLSGLPVEDILRVSPDFVTLLGLQQSLTPSRNNGFLNMLKLMQKKALQLYAQSDKEAEVGDENFGQQNLVGDDSSQFESNSSGGGGGDEDNNGGTGSSSSVVEENDKEEGDSEDSGVKLGSRGERIKQKLMKELKPTDLGIEDISYQHAGHAGVRGQVGGETHFNVRVVSSEFEGKSLVKRHRMVYALLQDELQNGLHALSIVAKTPDES
ncbi:sufE-like protein 1, chloroplastic/mitochondrial [Impatiens glandulifera]|uniref:sufE-like protein 1, chloroplastic/mitochondrial n=1 Tax=Impatiens glandulifera TaxID=253017 RepID=UPI001FB0DBFE|nr:sufE-like protein 1, chloroplastic/mitochondrial [Impatiens glandulifera]